MQKQIILIFICLINICQAQTKNYQIYKGDTINRKDAKGLKQGEWRKYYRSDTLCSSTFFKDDKPVNVSRTWNESGKLKAIVTFDKQNSKRAYGISYYENGKVMAKGIYMNQMKDSVWMYYGENDSVKSIEVYKNGKPDKTWSVYYENGKLAEETSYLNGKKEGLHKEYNEDGVLIFEMPYKSNNAEGVSKLYYRNGKVRTTGAYKNGLRQGKWLQYDMNGILLKEVNYINGKSDEEEENQE